MKKLLSILALFTFIGLTAADGGENVAPVAGAGQIQPAAQPIVQPIQYVVQPVPQLAVPYQPQMDRAKRRKLDTCKPTDEDVASARAQEAAARAQIPQGQAVPAGLKSMRQSLIDLGLDPSHYGY